VRNASKAEIGIFRGVCNHTRSVLKNKGKKIFMLQIFANTVYRLNFTDFRIIIKISK
jgi:hypothetical protein